MKHTLLFFLLVPVFSFAQWSTNPGQPLRVCSANSTQSNPRAFSDGEGGLFVFWEDGRSGDGNYPWLYVQRFSANGTKMLPDTGMRINTTTVGSPLTTAYGIAQDPRGNFWISWAAFPNAGLCDSIVINKFDKNTLNPIWPTPKLIAKNGPGLAALSAIETKILPDADSALVTAYVTWMGGSNVLVWNRINRLGERRLPGEGTFFTAGSGPYEMINNPFGGFYIVQRDGNGMGTGVTARRINRQGILVWGPQSITQGTSGLGYDMKVQEDGAGGFLMVYVKVGYDIMATRWDSSGNAVWTPAHKPVCDFSSNQDIPKFIYKNGFWYVTFSDNRGGSSSTYMQKIDLMGNRMWNPDGRKVFSNEMYLAHPRLLSVEGNDMIITSRTFSGFIGQKVRTDSTFAWPGEGMIICSPDADYPFYDQYTLTSGPFGKAFPVWVGFFSRRLFTASIDSGGVFTSNRSMIGESSEIGSVFPNPSENGLFNIQFPKNKYAELPFSVFSMEGKKIMDGNWDGNSRQTLDLSKQPAGLYQLKIFNQSGWQVVKIVKHR